MGSGGSKEEIMRYPEFLPEGGSIGFVAPSFGCNIEPYKTAFDHALQRFQKDGYRTVLGPNCYKGEGVGISNRPELCGAELNEMYCDSAADVIISCGGGELMCEVIPYMDWDRIRSSKPKWYLGYSDNTNFTFLSATIADTAALYGPCAPSFGMEPPAESILDAYLLLRGEKLSFRNYPLWEKESLKDEEHPTVPYNLTEPYSQRIFIPAEMGQDPGAGHVTAEFSGRLIGGCVDCLVTLAGTEYDHAAEFAERYKEDGIIWFLECCDLNPVSMRRAYFQMKHAGWFKYVKGFLIGRPLHFDEEMFGVNRYTAVTSVLGELGVPIVMDVDIGHLPPQIPVITGAMADVKAGNGSISLNYRLE